MEDGIWECSVCGYEHETEQPPGRCPDCGSAARRFVWVSDDGEDEIGGNGWDEGFEDELWETEEAF